MGCLDGGIFSKAFPVLGVTKVKPYACGEKRVITVGNSASQIQAQPLPGRCPFVGTACLRKNNVLVHNSFYVATVHARAEIQVVNPFLVFRFFRLRTPVPQVLLLQAVAQIEAAGHLVQAVIGHLEHSVGPVGKHRVQPHLPLRCNMEAGLQSHPDHNQYRCADKGVERIADSIPGFCDVRSTEFQIRAYCEITGFEKVEMGISVKGVGIAKR